MNLKSLSDSTTYTLALITVVTIASELSKPFKEILASLTGHHWVTKSVLTIVFFASCYYILEKYERKSAPNITPFYTGIAGILIISLFYIWHYFN